MHFQLNGQPYFLNFVPSEGRWFMFAPSAHGMQKIAVADDAHTHFDKFVLPPEEEQTRM
jgi:hypothetical protein